MAAMIPEILGGSAAEAEVDALSDPVELVLRVALVALLALAPLAIFLPRGVRRRRFWCAVMQREVEVELEENGPPGLRQAVGVRSCTAFQPPAAVVCERRCLDVAFRHPWAAIGVRA